MVSMADVNLPSLAVSASSLLHILMFVTCHQKCLNRNPELLLLIFHRTKLSQMADIYYIHGLFSRMPFPHILYYMYTLYFCTNTM